MAGNIRHEGIVCGQREIIFSYIGVKAKQGSVLPVKILTFISKVPNNFYYPRKAGEIEPVLLRSYETRCADFDDLQFSRVQ